MGAELRCEVGSCLAVPVVMPARTAPGAISAAQAPPWTPRRPPSCRKPVRCPGRTAGAGRLIEKDQAVVLLYGAANRDEDVFGENAEEFDITRKPNPHLAFGTGEHVCLGLSPARLEARVFFEELLARFHRIELTSDVLRMRSTMVPGIRTMHVRLGPATERTALR